MDIETRLTLFRDMISCCHNLYLWSYDTGFHLISSNCPEQTAINDLLVSSHRGEAFDSMIAAQNTPVILNNEMSLTWVMTPHMEAGELVRLYVLGPFFMDDVSPNILEAQITGHGLSPSLLREFQCFLQKLPVISLNRVFEYAVMLHYCITEEKITISDLRYYGDTVRNDLSQKNAPTENISSGADAHGTYEGEQEMLRMVREGDLVNYRAHMNKMSVTGSLGKLSNGNPLRQMKNAVLVCITLFSRAAIEGGLTPELSFTLTDHYFQSVEACTSISDLAEISHIMQRDFIQRVHRCRIGNLSKPIQTCCDYISLHLEDDLSLEQLAQLTGYSEYYLGKKFKGEIGQTPNEYIRSLRLQRAALLLRTTQDDIQDISARLQFCSQSYFADSFRKFFGSSPTEYRQQKKE